MASNETGGLLTRPPKVPKPRGETRNLNDPRGQLGAFLRDWIDRKPGREVELAEAMGVSTRTIRNWVSGTHGPPIEDLDRLASAVGFSDWSKLGSAVVRFNRRG